MCGRVVVEEVRVAILQCERLAGISRVSDGQLAVEVPQGVVVDAVSTRRDDKEEHFGSLGRVR